MTLNKKISLIIIVVVFTSLLASSAVNVFYFHRNYSKAMLSGSFGLAQNINSMISELVNHGGPLKGLEGINKKLRQVVEQNPHVSYAAIVDLEGVVLYHSAPEFIGIKSLDATMKASIETQQPIHQLYPRLDGHEYIDVTVPIFNETKKHLGAVRIGFPSEIITAKLREVLLQQTINYLTVFLVIALWLNGLLSKVVSQPILALSRYAKQITHGHYQALPPAHDSIEFKRLSNALQQLAVTIADQIHTLEQSQQELERLVSLRTEELADANQKLLQHNDTLEQTVTSLRLSELALSESETKFRHLFECSSDSILILTKTHIFDCNPATVRLFGCRDKNELCGKHPADISPPTQPNGLDSYLLSNQILAKTFEHGPQLFEWTHRRVDNGELFTNEIMLSPVVLDGQSVFQAVLRDISTRKREETRERQRQDVLERLINGEKLASILESIALNVERERPGVLCSILLLDDNAQHWLVAAAPSLPEYYRNALHGVEIGPLNAENILGQRQIIEDIQQTPDGIRGDVATSTGWRFNACWQEPIIGLHQKLLGNLMLYHPHPAKPNEDDNKLLHHVAHLCAISIERSRTENQQQLAATVFANSYEGIIITDIDDHIIDVNPAFTRITGYLRSEVIGQSRVSLQGAHPDSESHLQIHQALSREGHWRGEIWSQRKNGDVYPQMLAITAVANEEGSVKNYVTVFSDISLLKAHEEELNRIAHYDPLTGLPNRRLLSDRLKQAMAQAKRHGKLLAVCYLDLDGFKPINDRYGHEAGDQLLNALSKRLQNTLRGNDTLARLGGDEFVLLIGDLNATEECDFALNRTLAEVVSPFDIKGTPVTVSASIGVTLYPLDDVDGDTLLRQADHAMYRAKQLGKNRYQLFDPQRDRELRNRRDQMQALVHALRRDEFVLHYQPKVNLLDGTVIGAEALIRWQHPEKGLLQPGVFLDLFAGPELESELGHWVLGSALKQIDHWQSQNLLLKISVNISANHLLSKNFVDHLQTLLLTHPAVDPNQLELEVLETAAMDDMQRAVEIMSRCKALGVSFALDDFGTGYSSLAYFRRLPVDILKIDQGFVRDMLVDQEDFTIVESVVRLAQAFNRPVIAEGVETLDHAAQLVKLGCILAQGYGIARPMAAEALANWITLWQQQAAWQVLEAPSLPIRDLPLIVAAQNHKLWVEQLRQHLKNPTQQLLPPLSSQQCSFGYWCHGSGRKHYGHWPEFQDIDLIHERIHQLAAELIEELNGNEPDSLSALKDELEDLCKHMLEQLQDLMQKVSSQYNDKNQPLSE